MPINDQFALDKRVVLQAKSTVRGELNGPPKGWVNILPGDGKVWASITDITGHQYVTAGATQNAVQTQIKIRRSSGQRSGVAPSMRVLHGSVAYDIAAVLERDSHWTVLMCTRGLSNG